jgi:hypothetical protein
MILDEQFLDVRQDQDSTAVQFNDLTRQDGHDKAFPTSSGNYYQSRINAAIAPI